MKTELVVAIIAGCVALGSAIISARSALTISRLQRRYEAEKQRARFTEPLIRAAYDLQSRLYNILCRNLMEVYQLRGSERQREYTISYTVFLIAQYFAWMEAARRRIQYILLDGDAKTRRLTTLLDDIASVWRSDAHPSPLMVFSGEQRAIGEMMMEQLNADDSSCIGYGRFVKEVLPSHDRLLDSIAADVERLPETLEQARERLTRIQHALIDLLEFLDPKFFRFPDGKRRKV
jgi:hypothetical protein